MEILKQYLQTSMELKSILQEEITFTEQDHYLEKVEYLIAKRQSYLNGFPDLSSLEPSVKEEIIKLEREIKTLIDTKKTKIQNNLKILQVKKKKKNQYSNPYGDVSIDGMFLDKKK